MELKQSLLAAALGILVLGSATQASAQIRNGLVLHLTFDNLVQDSSGKMNPTTVKGAPTFQAGQIGRAIRFLNDRFGANPTRNFVTLGTPQDLNFGTDTDFTVAAWVKFSTTDGDPAIVSNKNWGSGSNTGYVIATDTDRRIQWNYREPSPNTRKDYDSSANVLGGEVWKHVVVTFDRQGNATTYVDGAQLDSRAINSAAAGTIDSGLATNIGNDGTGTYPDGLWNNGVDIDDVGIWRRVLTADEVGAIFAAAGAGNNLLNTGTASIATDLVVHLPFDGTYADNSGRGNNGTAVGSPSFVAGKVGQAVNCKSDGGSDPYFYNDYVELGNTGDYSLGTDVDFSYSFWTKFNNNDADPAFVSNKAWTSGGNPGFVLATDGDGRLQWNWTGQGDARLDYDGPAGGVRTDTWKHVVFTANRDGLLSGDGKRYVTDTEGVIKVYIDGVLQNTTPVWDEVFQWYYNIDTDMPINIGQDGTGAYPDGSWRFGMLMDDFGMWRRTLTAEEVTKIYEAGLKGRNLRQVDGLPQTSVMALRTSGGSPMLGYWRTDNGVVTGWKQVGAMPAGWMPRAIRDFNGDGNSDVMIERMSDGRLGVYRLNETGTIVGWLSSGTVAAGFDGVGGGDVDADGNNDLFVYNATTRALGAYRMNASAAIIGWKSVGTLPAGWLPYAIDDINGDMMPDVVVYNATLRRVGYYALTGTGALGAYTTIVNLPAGWMPVGMGDMNDDGKLDVLIRRASDGRIGAYLYNGTAVTGWKTVLNTTSSNWTVFAASDLF